MNVSKNYEYKEFNSINRYSSFPIYYQELDERYFGGITGQLDKMTPYKVYEVVAGDTLDSLALYYYNNSTRYWIIADFNNIQDPFKPLLVGSKIKIPNLSEIAFNKIY